MMWLISLFVILYFEKCIAIGIVPPDKLNQSLQIHTSHGLIQGSEKKSINGKSYFSYVGIPYAKPPLYELRFKSPKPMPKWSGVLDATIMGSCCLGLNGPKVMKMEFVAVGNEDCLHLNVYTPINSMNDNKNNPLAVMVYFYGGGYLSGCANVYKPDFMIENDVILIVPNYRISIFGYLSTEDLDCPGNWASKDQIAALEWAQLNIHKFGGDPKKVTIFGQSAGATMVNTLVLSQRAKGLFHGAIMMSGVSLSYWAYQRELRRIAFDIGVAVGIETNSSKTLLDELRKLDSKDLSDGHIPVMLLNFFNILTNGLPMTPSIEPKHKEAVLTDYPYDILEKGEFNKVPIMMGVTTSEMSMFRKALSFVKPLMVVFNLSPGLMIRMTDNLKNKTAMATEILKYFLKTTDVTSASEEDIEKLLSEEGYFRPSRKTASLIATHSPVYFYEFGYEGELGKRLIRLINDDPQVTSKNFKGVLHSEDVAYLFAFEPIETEYYENDMEMIMKLSKIYTNFAKTGNPTPIQDPFLDNVTWPRVTRKQFPYINIDNDITAHSENFNENNFQFWEDLFIKYAQKPFKVY